MSTSRMEAVVEKGLDRHKPLHLGISEILTYEY